MVTGRSEREVYGSGYAMEGIDAQQVEALSEPSVARSVGLLIVRR